MSFGLIKQLCFNRLCSGEYNLTFAPPPLRGGEKKSKIRNQGREFKTYKEKEGLKGRRKKWKEKRREKGRKKEKIKERTEKIS